MTFLEILEEAVNSLNDRSPAWDYKIDGAYMYECQIVAYVMHRMLVHEVPLEQIRDDSQGADMTVYDKAGDLVLFAHFKRITATSTTRLYVEGKAGTKNKGFLKDIEELRNSDAPEKAFVVFDPDKIIDRETWSDTKDNWYDHLQKKCDRGIKILIIGNRILRCVHCGSSKVTKRTITEGGYDCQNCGVVFWPRGMTLTP